MSWGLAEERWPEVIELYRPGIQHLVSRYRLPQSMSVETLAVIATAYVRDGTTGGDLARVAIEFVREKAEEAKRKTGG